MKTVPTMRAEEAAGVLERTIAKPKGDHTIADAAAASGLPLRAAEQGLHALVKKYRGHLRVTNDGDLIFRFPHGFSRPWIVPDALSNFFGKIGRGLLGVGRFVVRAWIMIVLVAYAVAFIAIAIAMATQSRGGSRDRGGSGLGVYFMFRILADALFWTFHPFSPFAYSSYGYAYDEPHARREFGRSWSPTGHLEPEQPKVPFYEKVNRFFFGPEDPPRDPLETERRLVAEIRAQKGRIGLADVMRVTGLPREEADPLMAKLLLDYEGTVEVSEGGGIVYRFEAMRKTIDASERTPSVAPVWSEPKAMPPLTGNDGASNFAIIALNLFNIMMSWIVIAHGWTIHTLSQMFSGVPEWKIQPDGTPIALGLVPFLFSLAILLLPLGRALLRPFKERKLKHENGRLAMLRTVLTRLRKGGVSDEEVKRAWTRAAGAEPSEREINREVAKLGGDVEIGGEGQVRYRFPDLEAEAEAVEAEREAAAESEARVGKVVFSSDA